MLDSLKKRKNEIILFFVIYLLIDIFVVGAFFVSGLDLTEDQSLFDQMEGFIPNLTNPLGTFGKLLSSGSEFVSFLKISLWALIAFVGMYIYYAAKNQKSYEYEGTESGSSDWSKNGEEYRKLPDGSETLNKKEGFILSKKHYLGTDLKKVKLNKNILVVGGSGAGKSACFVKPNILQRLGSYVITDPKGELYRETSNYLRQNGYNVKVLNLINTDYSDRYNPLAHIKEHSDVDIIAQTIVMGGENDGKSSDPFWDNTAKMLLKACIYYVISVLPVEKQNLSSCLNIVRSGGSDETIFDKLFVDELKPDHPGRKEYESIRLGADKTKQSIAISLVSKLSHFDTPAMMKVTTTNDFDFSALGKEKTAIYVITPPDTDTYDYILTVFFGQLLQRLFSDAGKLNGTLPQPVYLLLDEFANIGQIPAFDKKLSTTRSYGISISIIVQSLDQIESIYKNTYENIIGNCDTQIFLGSQSIKTCEYFSKSLGQKTIKFTSKSVSKDKKGMEQQGVSFSEQRQGRELMTVDELKRLDTDLEILLVRGLKPIKAEKAWYFKFHPQKDIVRQTEIRDLSQMAKPPEVEIDTMDVTDHLEQRVKRAKERIKQDSPSITGEPVEFLNENKEKLTNKIEEVKVEQEEEIYDLQKQLEAKFDELFGNTENH